MSRSTKQEINDAIAVVQQGLNDGSIEYYAGQTGWYHTETVSRTGEYRAKPDPVEFWILDCWDGRGIKVSRVPQPEPWIKVREVTDE